MCGSPQKTPTSTAPGKLTAEQKDQVCRKLAAFIGPTEICRWLESEHGIQFDKSSVLHYRDSDAWADKFARYRAEWQTSTRDRQRLANVSGRVEELEKMFTAVTHDLARSHEESVQQRLRAELRDILEQIREEIPGGEMTGSSGIMNINLPDWYYEGRQMKPKGESNSPVA